MHKASGGDGIPVELFQILKDDAVKELNSICQQICKTEQGPLHWKMSVLILIPRKANVKECSNSHIFTLIFTLPKCKILQASLQQYLNHNSLMFKLGLEKSERQETFANIHWIIEKQENSRRKKKSISALLTMSKHLTACITTNCGKFFKRWEYQTTLLFPGKSVCRSRSNS